MLGASLQTFFTNRGVFLRLKSLFFIENDFQRRFRRQKKQQERQEQLSSPPRTSLKATVSLSSTLALPCSETPKCSGLTSHSSRGPSSNTLSSSSSRSSSFRAERTCARKRNLISTELKLQIMCFFYFSVIFKKSVSIGHRQTSGSIFHLKQPFLFA